MMLEGRCHCGAVEVAFETALDPDVIQVRACQCGFCRSCGAYVAAVMEDGEAAFGVLNIAASDIEVLTHRAADSMHYEDETIDRKRDRRRARRTPASILIEGAPA